MLTLPEYIKRLGIPEFAKRFDVTERAAKAYYYGERRPKPNIAQRIVDNSPVTWAGVYAAQDGAE